MPVERAEPAARAPRLPPTIVTARWHPASSPAGLTRLAPGLSYLPMGTQAPDAVKRLVDHFDSGRATFLSPQYNEAQLRQPDGLSLGRFGG
jgi:hypothetical protein